MSTKSTPGVPRRQLLCGALLLGAAGAGVLAGCGTTGTTGATGSSSSTPTDAAGTALALLADIPVGGGTMVTTPSGVSVLLVQPVAGTVKAYSPRCTHQGSIVHPPQNGLMTCPTHGSEFKADDGSVVRGPAVRPLEPIAVKVTGQDVTLA
jgi:cytochrome b6-f complex iron-sulfur subunit